VDCECPVRRVPHPFVVTFVLGRKGRKALPGPELPVAKAIEGPGTNPTRPESSWDLGEKEERMSEPDGFANASP